MTSEAPPDAIQKYSGSEQSGQGDPIGRESGSDTQDVNKDPQAREDIDARQQSLSLRIATNPRLQAVASDVSQQYQEVSMLPSPKLGHNNGLFESFSGTAQPPVAFVSRAPSLHRRAPQFDAIKRQIGTESSVLTLPPALEYEDRVLSDVLHTIRESPTVGQREASLPPYEAPVGPLTVKSPQKVARDKLVLPKRSDRVDLGRSKSVGTHRQATVSLHREERHKSPSESPSPASAGTEAPQMAPGRPSMSRAPSAATIYRRLTTGGVKRFADKEDVYVAFDSNLHRGTWDRMRFLGKGSFSQVILATPTLSQVKPEWREEASNIVVAVKITSLGSPRSPDRGQLEEALRRDLELVKELHHPNLMPILAFNIDTERAVEVLPYCPGGDLFDLVAKHRTSLKEPLVRRLYADVVSAIAYLHANNVVHRDIKLENILIDIPVDDLLTLEDPLSYAHPLAVVTDLGLARRIDPENPLLTTRCGSEDYVPPELLMGQPYDGRQTDSWACGVLLYAVLEGRLPFDPPPHGHPEGPRARLRTVHRIARVEWAWHKRKESSPEWSNAKELVGACLRRRDDRLLVSEMVKMPYIANAIPRDVAPMHQGDIMDIFEQDGSSLEIGAQLTAMEIDE